MQPPQSPRITAAEKLDKGLVIKFDDGNCAFYSAPLLYAIYPQALALDETESLW